MSGTAQGARRAAATRIGITLAEYDAHRDSGMRWCGTCKAWQPAEEFGVDASRADGVAVRCRKVATARTGEWQRRNREARNAWRRQWRASRKEAA